MPLCVLLDQDIARCTSKTCGHRNDVSEVVTCSQNMQTIPVVTVPVCPGLHGRGIGQRDLGAVHRSEAQSEAESFSSVTPTVTPTPRVGPPDVATAEAQDDLNYAAGVRMN